MRWLVSHNGGAPVTVDADHQTAAYAAGLAKLGVDPKTPHPVRVWPASRINKLSVSETLAHHNREFKARQAKAAAVPPTPKAT